MSLINPSFYPIILSLLASLYFFTLSSHNLFLSLNLSYAVELFPLKDKWALNSSGFVPQNNREPNTEYRLSFPCYLVHEQPSKQGF